jgi:hypothetical protein
MDAQKLSNKEYDEFLEICNRAKETAGTSCP